VNDFLDELDWELKNDSATGDKKETKPVAKKEVIVAKPTKEKKGEKKFEKNSKPHPHVRKQGSTHSR
jgi:hypothetical protein